MSSSIAPFDPRPNDPPPRIGDLHRRNVWPLAICSLLVLLVVAVFGQTLRHDFLACDDSLFVYENPHVQSGLTPDGLRWAMTDGALGEWCPLSTLSHMLDCEIFGLNPGAHHLTNLLLHAASSVLLFLVLLRLTGDLWPSAAAAAIFAVHPLRAESVAWIAERRDVLSGLFFMLTLWAYARYVERPSAARYLALAALFALGLMSKPILVTVPLLLLLLDYWPLGRWQRASAAEPFPWLGGWFARLPTGGRLLVEKIPLLALSAATCWIVLITHASMQSANPMERWPLATRLANTPVAYAAYLGQFFYPVDLAPLYPHPGNRLSAVSIVGTSLLLVTITGIAFLLRRQWPYLLVGWLWFLGMLVPVSGLVQNGPIARADRYTYLSQIGLSIALVWGVYGVYRSRPSLRATRVRRATFAVLSCAVVLMLAGLAWRQTSFWRDDELLWMHAVDAVEQNIMPRANLARFYIREGMPAKAMSQLRAAVAAPSYDRRETAEAHCMLAKLLTEQGETDESLSHFEQAVTIYPEVDLFHGRFARALARAGKHQRAIVQWRESIRLVPPVVLQTDPRTANILTVGARVGLAESLLASGDADAAVAECQEILRNNPGLPQAVFLLGDALLAAGRSGDAVEHFEQAVGHDTRDGEARFHLGLALDQSGRTADAIAELDEAIRLGATSADVLWQAAWIRATTPEPTLRDGKRATELATQAIERFGASPHALDALGAALAETGDFPAAINAAEKGAALASAANDSALSAAIDERIRLYRNGLPYRQPASSHPASTGR